MESIAITYQPLCEVRFSHQYLTGSLAGLPVQEWITFYPDEDTTGKLRNKRLLIRPYPSGLRIAAEVKAPAEPLGALNGTRLRIGFSLNPNVAAHTKLDAHFTVGGAEGRYAFGNSIARLNGGTFPDISTNNKIAADPTEQNRVFGYLEIDILKGADPYDLLNNAGLIKYQKGGPAAKFDLLFEQ
ncbi:hypothetical protein [Chitinophaga alhagiae]|uniref:hypothetical protein n=1 Tax=Chitinophaga alhagiae TaxID=2203219 RepID=UPI000E5ABDA5|nr:hypothetical protein [Chitinophaga alhagiae]